MTEKTPETKKPFINTSGLNLIVNTLTFICLTILTITGLFILKNLHGHGETWGGFSKNSWTELHEHVGILMVLIVIYHLILHRKWIICACNGKMLNDAQSKKRVWFALGISLLIIFAISLASLFESH